MVTNSLRRGQADKVCEAWRRTDRALAAINRHRGSPRHAAALDYYVDAYNDAVRLQDAYDAAQEGSC